MRKLLTRKELVEASGGKLTAWTIGELTRRGAIPVVKLPGVRKYLYDLEAIEKWLDELQSKTTTQGLKLVK
jgi:hypothetical protein